MRYLTLLLFVLFFFPNLAFAQAGVSFYYASPKAPGWDNITKSDFAPALGAGMSYHFRLKNYRIEFFPEAFGIYTPGPEFYQEPEPGALLYSRPGYLQAGLKIPVRFYFFDMEGDCNCPTWSKQGTLLKKGFFFHLYPQAGWLFKSYETGATTAENRPPQINRSTQKDLFFGGGGGIGLDIGLSKYLTLTPTINYDWSSETEWNLIVCYICGILPQKSTLSNLTFGLNLSFAWNE